MRLEVSSTMRPDAQVGIAAVLMMAILLVVALGVSQRVVLTARQETQRQESTQALNQAESSAVAAGGLDGTDGVTGGIDVAVATKDSDRKGAVIYLDKGKTIKIPFDKSDTNIIYWHYNPDASAASSNAQLMLTNIYMDGTTKKSKSRIIVPHDYSGTYGGSTNKSKATLVPASERDSRPYSNKFNINGITGFNNGEIIITALKDSTHIYMSNLAKRTRSAAQNLNGTEVRVVEQSETDAAAPVVFNYSLFVGAGSITDF